MKKLIILGVLFSTVAWAAAPLGGPKAKSGGTVYYNLDAEPTTLNPFSATDGYSGQVHDFVFDSLMTRDIETYEWVPAVAEKYEMAKDGSHITFYLRKDAVFSDGKPITAEDVKFTYEAVFNPEYKAIVKQSFFENFSGVDVIDPHTVRFNIKRKYFLNFNVAAGNYIVPKHIYGNPKKKMNKTVLGSGPYKLETYNQGQSIILTKNDKWWGWNVPYYKGYFNFDKIHFRFIKDDNSKLETLKKGNLDFLALSPEQYVLKTKGDPWGKTVFTEKIENLTAKPTPFIGWNFNHDIFNDKNVRLAMTHLFDREGMAKKFYFGYAEPATGPWYQQSPYANPKTKALPFDPKKAKELLAKAGWKDEDKNGVLEKTIDGKKREFRFTLLNPNKDYEKYFTVYREELKKAGIDMSIANVEWNAFVKKLDEKDFEAVFLVWGGVIEGDPKQIWHSENMKPGGSNFISYSNPKVDALIDKAREELDVNKRKKLLHEIYDLIAQDAPYTFLLNLKYGFYAYSNRVERPRPTFKYATGTTLWWMK